MPHVPQLSLRGFVVEGATAVPKLEGGRTAKDRVDFETLGNQASATPNTPQRTRESRHSRNRSHRAQSGGFHKHGGPKIL